MALQGTELIKSATASSLVGGLLTFISLLVLPLVLWAQTDNDNKIVYTLYLVGDAGEPDIINQPLGNVLRKKVEQSGSNTTVIYLGDNIYPKGMPDQNTRGRTIAEKIIDTQARWIRGLEAKGIFIPGNHDWQRGKRRGYTYLKNQQEWLDSLRDENITLLPRDGCPGPVEIPLTDNSVLVILDTQWPLHPWDKPEADSECEAKSPADLWLLLSDVFNRNAGKQIILAAHHPLISHGEHGGVFQFKDHIFPLTSLRSKLYVPLPIVGSIYPLYRKWFGNIQDIAHPQYKEMSFVIRKLMVEYPGTIYASGHEHALQYLVKDGTHFIVSGSGAKTTFVKKKKFSLYAEPVSGFAKVAIYKNGSSTIEFWRVDKNFPDGIKTFSAELPAHQLKAKSDSLSSLLNDTSAVIVRTSASDQYRADKNKRAFLGANYRSAWAQEIDVPVFNIGKEKGGLRILQKGGGMQTLSLRLADSTGREFVLRSVEKFPEKAVPEMLRNTFAQDLVQDQISASHPYAALVIPPLAEAARIYHTNPKVVYIPDDKRLGIYRRDFSNALALFEERPTGSWSTASNFGYSSSIINTSKLFGRLSRNNFNQVDEKFVLRSRLFDMWIGDWDRHDGQWRWAAFQSGPFTRFEPIPRDRDQAFFVNEGFLPKLWSRRWTLPQFEGFDGAINWPSGLAYNARYFDRSFLTRLSKEDWIQTANFLREKLTDEVIEKSIREWPEEIQKLDGDEIVKKLKARRSELITAALSHYYFLAKDVDVVGSDKNELFLIDRLSNGDVHVRSYNKSRNTGFDGAVYDRVFKRSETREIRLYGLGGNDRIELSGAVPKSILVRIIGGDGVDSLIDQSHVNGLKNKTLYYDLKDENFSLGNEVGNRTSRDPTVNLYDRKAFKYNKLAPLVFGNFNPDDGFFIGGGALFQTEGFRGTPFSQRHIALFALAPRTASYNFLYRGDFTNVIGHWGLELNADLKVPNYVNNFFGPGNESIFDQDIDEKPEYDLDRAIDYYRFRFEELKLEMYLTRRIGEWGMFKAGPVLQKLEVEHFPDEDRYINEYASSLSYDLFEEDNAYAGVGWRFTIDKRNSDRLTTRGVVFNVAGRNVAGLDRHANNFSSYESSVSFYQSFRLPARVVFAARFGGGINTGNFQFYQAQILGGRTELRGFRKTRFYGDSKLYSNVEMRIKLFSLRTYLFPASLGVLMFHDLGRVWYKDENNIDPSSPTGKSDKWHKGWGGGVWFTPFNLTVLSVEAGHSVEGTLGYVRLGFLF